jgi:hypothetical protein
MEELSIIGTAQRCFLRQALLPAPSGFLLCLDLCVHLCDLCERVSDEP